MPMGPRERAIAEKIKATDYYYVGAPDRLKKLRKLQKQALEAKRVRDLNR